MILSPGLSTLRPISLTPLHFPKSTLAQIGERSPWDLEKVYSSPSFLRAGLEHQEALRLTSEPTLDGSEHMRRCAVLPFIQPDFSLPHDPAALTPTPHEGRTRLLLI